MRNIKPPAIELPPISRVQEMGGSSHPRDDGVGHERAQPYVGGLVAPALPADRVVEVAHTVRPLRGHESSSLRSSISPLVMYPS